MAREVLEQYPLASSPRTRRADAAPLALLGNAGGFSGARLWRVDSLAGRLCLRAWPSRESSAQRLSQIHRLMVLASEAGLRFVPVVLVTSAGGTWVEAAGRLWDLTTWMPGQADFHAHPTRPRLEAACTALAHLHRAWAGVAPTMAPCPAVQRRLERIRDWTSLVESGWDPRPWVRADDPVRPWLERAWPLLRQRIEQIPQQLASWTERPVPLQPCLCDVWHDHLLFTADEVTGLIDFGSIKVDHVAIDLARLLGSLIGDDAESRAVGLGAYGRVCRLSPGDEALVAVLDETGTLLGAANWLMWLYQEGRTFDDRTAVARRLGELVERIERWGPTEIGKLGDTGDIGRSV
jgi:Ser/Thr protein kinase RdoA (MazF antagonist)